MQFVFLTAHFSNNDAVCNDAIMIGEFLEKEGHRVAYYAPGADPDFRKPMLRREEFCALAGEPQTIVVYEHCIYMPAFDDLFREARCKIWFRYQNITPPRFYERYDPVATHATKMGLEQTARLVKDPRISTFLPGSEFTATDLVGFGADKHKIHVIAPVSRVDDFKNCKIEPSVESRLRADPKVNNLLFVGRVVPNKGHRHLIEVLRAYISSFGPAVHLWVVGSLLGQYRRYYEELEQIIEKYRIGDHVTFTGSISFSGLHTFYQCSDVFLLLSEHEGFCVPITEAQYHGLPIVAVDHGPFKDAIGQNQLMTSDYDYDFLAAACRRLKYDKKLASELASAGRKNLENFTPAALNNKIKAVLRTHQPNLRPT